MLINSSLYSFGLASQRSPRARMTAAHQHDDIEFNLAATPLSYRIDSAVVELPARRLAAFWAARPHQLIDTSPDASVHWLTVPLGLFLSWPGHEQLSSALVRGEVVLFTEDPLGASALGRLEQWSADLATGSAWSETTVRLEIEAYLRRIQFAPLRPEGSTGPAAAGGPARLAGLMAEYISARSSQPITVADVARAVHVHPGYAMTIFSRVVGTTIGSYLNQCRVAHAQRLLITSNLAVQDIGALAGFQSVSQFYDRFGAACGTAPGAYRRTHARREAS